MTFDQALKLEEYCLKNKNYQYNHLTSAGLMPMALKSFARLPKADQEKITSTWIAYKYNIQDCIRLRFMAQTNLFFLCKLLEKYAGVSDKEYILDGETHNTHEEICNNFFVRKDPTYESFAKFAASYTELKERLLLIPRGCFKSSIDIADCVQWIINYPEVTILILTGVYGLAKDFVGELSGHFSLQETGKVDAKDKPIFGPKVMPDGSNSIFQVLFPEHCIKETLAKETEFQTPASKLKDKEPTVMAASIEQTLSGWHFGILKLDDCVTNENTLTLTRMESVIKQVSVNKAMLHPFGFFDKIGTWYDEADVYGVDIKYEEKLKQEGEPPSMKIYLRAAWWPTEEATKLGKIEEEMKKEDWVLLFPQDDQGINRLTYEFLLKESKKDPDGFAIKYLNDPTKVHQVKFPRELLIRRTIPATMLPGNGMIVQVWDTAYSLKNFADYTVGVTALIYAGKFYIIDVVRGKYNEYDLPAMIATTGYRWKPRRISIEDSMGVRWLTREIRREMDKLGISIPIDFVPTGSGNKPKRKEIMAKPVVRLLGDERFFFSNTCGNLEEVYNEMEKFPKGTHDDVVDGMSILVDQYAAYADIDAKMTYVQTEFIADKKSKAMHDMLYGLGAYSSFNANMSENPVTTFEINQFKGFEDVAMDIDPFEELMR